MPSNLDSLFKTDKTLEREGIWFRYTDTVRFRLKRFGGFNSEKLKPLYASVYKPYAGQIEKGSISAEKQNELLATIFIKACMVDWEGVELDGKEAPFSFENALKLLTELPDLLDSLVKVTQDSANYKEDLGNS